MWVSRKISRARGRLPERPSGSISSTSSMTATRFAMAPAWVSAHRNSGRVGHFTLASVKAFKSGRTGVILLLQGETILMSDATKTMPGIATNAASDQGVGLTETRRKVFELVVKAGQPVGAYRLLE